MFLIFGAHHFEGLKQDLGFDGAKRCRGWLTYLPMALDVWK
jgi:hypothetical protein